jgi:hypothetical protein
MDSNEDAIFRRVGAGAQSASTNSSPNDSGDG